MSNYKPVKVALVGVGGWVEHIAEAVKKSKKLKLVSCFTRTPEKREKFSKKYNCGQAESFEDLSNGENVEAILFTTPNFVHCDQTVLASKAGKHIFVDKPIANTLKDAFKMVRVCKKGGVVLSVGHNTRRAAGHRKMKNLIDKGVLGNIVMIEANLSNPGGLNLTPEKWRWYKSKCPACPLMQLGIHHIDTLNYLIGPVKKVSAFFNKLYTPAEVDDVITIIVQYESGILGYVGSNYATPSIYYINIYGTEANAFCENGVKLFLQKKGSVLKEEIKLSEVDTVREELDEFADCIREGRKPEVSGKEAIAALAVVEAAIKSAENGKTVKINEVKS